MLAETAGRRTRGATGGAPWAASSPATGGSAAPGRAHHELVVDVDHARRLPRVFDRDLLGLTRTDLATEDDGAIGDVDLDGRVLGERVLAQTVHQRRLHLPIRWCLGVGQVGPAVVRPVAPIDPTHRWLPCSAWQWRPATRDPVAQPITRWGVPRRCRRARSSGPLARPGRRATRCRRPRFRRPPGAAGSRAAA